MVTDRETLEAALVGLEARRREVDERIADVRARLSGKIQDSRLYEVNPKKRHMSAEGRERIAAAARKRWAAVNKAKRAKSKPAKKPKAKARAKKEKPAPAEQVA